MHLRKAAASRIEVREFSPLCAPAVGQRRERQFSRDWSRALGIASTLSLHGLALHSLVLGSTFHKPHPPDVQGAGSSVQSTAPPAEELVLVAMIDAQKNDTDLGEKISSLGPHLQSAPVIVESPDPLPSMGADSTDLPDSSAPATPDAGDPAVRALMFGRYTGQISARIERSWRRPRSPVIDETGPTAKINGADGSTENDTFRCRVQIRQDSRGNVQEVLLLECNGTEEWRHSLVVAINQSSPLPAPPIPTVFMQAITMSFEAHAYQAGASADEYEIEPRLSATERHQAVRPAPLIGAASGSLLDQTH
jgi:hypothetical protein